MEWKEIVTFVIVGLWILGIPFAALAEDDDSLGGWLLMGGLIIALLALFGILPRSWVSDTGGYWAAW